MAAQDPVRDFLREKGCGEHIVERGLDGLVETWENTVQSVEEGYSLGLDDYLNDMDARQLMEEALGVAPLLQRQQFAERISRADGMMKSLVEPLRECLWGEEVAEEEGWTAKENWWYFSRPINAGADLLGEIDEAMEDR